MQPRANEDEKSFKTSGAAECSDAAAPAATPHQSLSDVLAALQGGSSDHWCIELWLATRAEGSHHTLRAYRREAVRFALWLRVEHARSLGQARLQDCLAYRQFLANPMPVERWCGPRGPEVGSGAWRPFEGPLSVGARRQSVVILTSLYRFMRDQGMAADNPWSAVKTPRHADPSVDAGRSLTAWQLATVREVVQRGDLCVSEHDRRQLRWMLDFLYATGLRCSELIGARVGDLRWVDLDAAGCVRGRSPAVQGGWVLEVLGKGQRHRLVPVPAELIDELADLMTLRGWPAHLETNRSQPLLVAWSQVPECADRSHRTLPALSARGLARKLKQVFATAAQVLDACGRHRDAEIVRRATVHWIRHTCATHAVAADVPLDVVSRNLGHASLATTSIYVRAQLGRRIEESQRLSRGPAPAIGRAAAAAAPTPFAQGGG